MDSEFEFSAPKFYDFDAESSGNVDNQYFNKCEFFIYES